MSERRLLLKDRVSLESGPEDGGRCLIDTRTATICSCNEVAWNLLEELAAGTTLSGLVRRLTGEFDVDAETARSDVLDFLRRLTAMGLVGDYGDL